MSKDFFLFLIKWHSTEYPFYFGLCSPKIKKTKRSSAAFLIAAWLQSLLDLVSQFPLACSRVELLGPAHHWSSSITWVFLSLHALPVLCWAPTKSKHNVTFSVLPLFCLFTVKAFTAFIIIWHCHCLPSLFSLHEQMTSGLHTCLHADACACHLYVYSAYEHVNIETHKISI